MNYSTTQQQYTNFQPSYQQQDLNAGLPYLNQQNGVATSNPAAAGMQRPMSQADVQHQLNYRASNASLSGGGGGGQQAPMQLNTPNPYGYNTGLQQQQQSRPQSTYSLGHDASTYAPSSPGATSFMTMSERRMSRDSNMEGMDDPRPLVGQDFYRRTEDAGSRLSQNNMSLRRGSMASNNPMESLRRPHIAPPIFTHAVQDHNSSSNNNNTGGAGGMGYDKRGSALSRTYPYPHPNAAEPTAGFPYAFPDPDLGDDGGSSSQPSLHNQQLQAIMAAGETPYSRSPELRVSHKLAERKRRREMKDLFDDLRDKLPLDRTLKTSKWEILSKAVEHLGYLEDQINALRQENEEMRRAGGGHYRA